MYRHSLNPDSVCTFLVILAGHFWLFLSLQSDVATFVPIKVALIKGDFKPNSYFCAIYVSAL